MNLVNLQNMLRKYEDDPETVNAHLSLNRILDTENVFLLSDQTVMNFPKLIWSVGRPVQPKKPQKYENKALGIKKNLTYEAFVASDDLIGEPSHFFSIENSSRPDYALIKTYLSMLVKVEEYKLAVEKAKSKK